MIPGPPKKRYCNDCCINEMVDCAEMKVETEGVEARTSTKKGVEARNSTTEGVKARNRTKVKGKEKVSKDASDVETKRCTVEVDTKTEYQSDDDSDCWELYDLMIQNNKTKGTKDEDFQKKEKNET
nr:hypothetical protein [Tanacetum cinerariifolium]